MVYFSEGVYYKTFIWGKSSHLKVQLQRRYLRWLTTGRGLFPFTQQAEKDSSLLFRANIKMSTTHQESTATTGVGLGLGCCEPAGAVGPKGLGDEPAAWSDPDHTTQ